jgi:hypothetical protein
VEVTQILCPTCHGAQSAATSGNYKCEWCLAPFTVVDARREEQRLKSQDEGWLQQRLGGSVGGAAVDAASRAFIFRQRLLPDLKRDVDRALEGFTNYRQHALVLPPVPVPPAKTQSRNPLLDQRDTVLGLSGLRARLGNDAILGFAVAHEDQAALQSMERRMADVVHLSNVADAGARRDEVGYAVARRNLEALIVEIDQSIAQEAGGDAGLAWFLAALRSRYAAMAEFARACEETCSENSVSGAEMAQRLEVTASRLLASSQNLQDSPYDPAQTMPCVVGMQVESAAIRVFARWLRSYDIVTSKCLTPFREFLCDIESLCTGAASTPDAKADLLEATTDALLTMRGERDAPVISDFSWVDAWAETGRAKKTWGLFGNEETINQTVRFLAPVWVAEISYSASTGAVFKEGVEGKALALLDACALDPARVCFLDGTHASLADSLGHAGRLVGGDVALPRSTAASANGVFAQAAKGRPNMLNARIQVRGLAWLPAAVAEFSSPKGSRSAISCMNGFVVLADAAVRQIDVSRQIVQRFG